MSEPINVLLAAGESGLNGRIDPLLRAAPGPRLNLTCVNDYVSAETAMAASDYEVCLLDVGLGQHSGLDLVYRTLLTRAFAPLIMLADRDDYDLDVEVTHAGCAGFLVKDQLTPELLERSIRLAIERKRIESSLHRKSQDHASLIAAIEQVSVGVLVSDPSLPDNPLTFVNSAFTTITGYSSEEALGHNCRFLTHPDADQEMVRELRSAISDKRLFKGIVLNRRKDGSAYHNSLVICPVFDGQGMLVNYVATTTDVSERVRLIHDMQLLAAIVEGSDFPIFGKTLEGIVTTWNPAAEVLYGYTAAEMIGQSIKKLLPHRAADDVGMLLERVGRGETVRSYETVRLAKDGTSIDVSLTISPIKDGAGRITGASTIDYDIRQRKKNEAQIERHIQRIQALRNIDMAITASLDLRVTLNVLLDQVTAHLNVDAAAVALLNPHTKRLEYTAGRGLRTPGLVGLNMRIGEGFTGKAVLDKAPVFVPNLNINEMDPQRRSYIEGEGFVSFWGMPLITKGRVEGVLQIFHRSPLVIDNDWVSFMEALAGQAAIAIENAGLFNELQRSNMELEFAYDSTLEGWSKALDLRDKETEGHTLRVTETTLLLARRMGVDGEALMQMRRGALLHDIGKMGIPDAILLKPGPLSPEEWTIMKQHPVYANELLSPIPFLREALAIPYCHHEKWDGTGYPRGLRGEQIPLGVRIFTVIDVWDALSSDRPYRKALPPEDVKRSIESGSGSHFDPKVVQEFLKLNL